MSLRAQSTTASFAREALSEPPAKSLEEFDQPKWNDLVEGSAGKKLREALFKEKEHADKAKTQLKSDLELLKACLHATTIRKSLPASQFALLFLYDAFREDSSLYAQCEEVLREHDGHGFFLSKLQPILTQKDVYSADKAAWLLTSIMTNCSYHYSKESARSILDIIFAKECTCSALGKLEATCNLLKSVDFRAAAWGCADAMQCVLSVGPDASAQMLYKYMFALWMLSYDKVIAATLQERDVVPNIKQILATCRVEKVVRLGMIVIRNFLPDAALALDIVETETLDVVQQLEFEKWRDAEIYDDIREVCQLVGAQVSKLSNFDKYEKELAKGHLKWGYLHSNKFWGENIGKFDQKEFGAIKTLCTLLHIDDEETQAVACHDIGEFAVLHPLGKKKVVDFQVKEHVMKLM